jgi:L-2-hydroxyglutarate oxidase LhgO
MTARTTDFLVIGGGVMGLSLALEIRRRFTDASVTVLEKERSCGLHASGRNSGVLHAGFYYSADSLKARFTREGNQELTRYCEERGLRLNRCGKLVVARDETEVPTLDELLRRGRANGVELRRVSVREAHEIEPKAKTVDSALFSPTTSSVDPAEVMGSLDRDARSAGVTIETGNAYVARVGREIQTTGGRVSPGYVINSAGLYADKVARDFGFSSDYRILPFKGLYLNREGDDQPLRVHVYPVPSLDHPFLGVHWTVTVDGRCMIGPTAIPALWREHYGGLANFNPRELLEIGILEASLWLRNEFGFRRLALREVRKHSRTRLVALAGELVRAREAARWSWGEPGVRAQLLNVTTGRLEMDFRYEGDDRSFHVLNVVSPGFTCALPFARHLLDVVSSLMTGRREAASKPEAERPLSSCAGGTE